MRDTTGMPQLNRNAALFSVNARGDFLPCRDLLRAMEARRTGVTLRLSRDLRGFRDDQARACALTVDQSTSNKVNKKRPLYARRSNAVFHMCQRAFERQGTARNFCLQISP